MLSEKRRLTLEAMLKVNFVIETAFGPRPNIPIAEAFLASYVYNDKNQVNLSILLDVNDTTFWRQMLDLGENSGNGHLGLGLVSECVTPRGVYYKITPKGQKIILALIRPIRALPGNAGIKKVELAGRILSYLMSAKQAFRRQVSAKPQITNRRPPSRGKRM